MFRNIYLHTHVYGDNVKKSGQKLEMSKGDNVGGFRGRK